MIIVISGKQGAGKSTFARALAASILPQYPYVIDQLPTKKPAFLGQMTIFTWPSDSEFPNWLLKRKDFTIINISVLKEKLPQPVEGIGLHLKIKKKG